MFIEPLRKDVDRSLDCCASDGDTGASVGSSAASSFLVGPSIAFSVSEGAGASEAPCSVASSFLAGPPAFLAAFFFFSCSA